jgi:hypothetical protein
MGSNNAHILWTIAMTRFEPSLFVRRLLVEKDSKLVVDVDFHHGVNVIAGENSSGKTTLIRFLAYGLGAENIQFNRIAALCNVVLCEIELNGAIVTLRREITGKSQAGMSIFWGPAAEAIEAAVHSWLSFPFRRSDAKQSFSQILFSSLALPELRGEAGNNITMHQVLRLVYSDQETPGAELFRNEKFDTAVTRQAVGDYLLGIDDNDLYELQLRAIALEKEDSAIGSALRSVYEALGRAETDISLDFIEQRIIDIGGEINSLQQKLSTVVEPVEADTSAAQSADDSIRNRLSELHRSFSNLKDRALDVEKQISESELLLVELASRAASAEESIGAATYLGSIKFSTCPCCLADISARDASAERCTLCNSPIEEAAARTQLLRMKTELELQVRESTIVRDQLISEQAGIGRELGAVGQLLKAAEDEFKRTKTAWRTGFEVQRESMLTRLGSLEQELKQVLELRKLAQSLDEQRQRKALVNAELSEVRDRMAAIRHMQRNRREEAYEAVARHLQLLLKNDIPRAEEFANPREVFFDFGSNRVTVDLQQQFSASSMVYLRHSFHLALLFASLEKSFFRFPRLVIIDGIEDGGMEPDRSFNFQELILRISRAEAVEHQIVIATSTIAPSLDHSEFLATEKLSHEHRSVGILS